MGVKNIITYPEVDDLTGEARPLVINDKNGTPAVVHGPEIIADSTTGQLQIGGQELGDTGWRDVSSIITPLLLNGWVLDNKVLVRRTGNVVHWIWDDLNATSATNVSMLTFTNGAPEIDPGFLPDRNNFRGRTYFTAYGANGGNNQTWSVRWAFWNLVVAPLVGNSHTSNTLGTGASAILTAQDYIQFTFSQPIENAWPTSLPGVAYP